MNEPVQPSPAVKRARAELREAAGEYAVGAEIDAFAAAVRADEKALAEAHYSSLSAADGEYVETLKAKLSQVDALGTALERITTMCERLGHTPVRDMAETIAEARAALDAWKVQT